MAIRSNPHPIQQPAPRQPPQSFLPAVESAHPYPTQAAALVALPSSSAVSFRIDSLGDPLPYAFERGSSLGQSTASPSHVSATSSARPDYGAEYTLPPSSYTETNPPTNCSKLQQKSKLPHGLTVQELKEMTKARLQAEAATKSNQVEMGQSIQMGQALSEASPSSRGQPLTIQQLSPIPPGFASDNHHSVWPSSSSCDRTENWDSLSIGGSDPVPGSVGEKPSSDVFLLVPTQVSVASELDANRLRPNAAISQHLPLSMPEDSCSVLGHRPPYSSEARERSFSSDAHSDILMPHQPRSVNRERAFSSDTYPSLHHHHPHASTALLQRQGAGLPGAFTAPIAMGSGSGTTSGSSLSSTLHTANSLSIDSLCQGNNSALNSNRFPSPFGAVREDEPLGTPGLADVFRVSSFDKSTGMMSSSPSSMYPQDLGCLPVAGFASSQAADNRMRAATWSEPGSLFGSSGNDFDDLASILKLSGATETNHFLPIS